MLNITQANCAVLPDIEIDVADNKDIEEQNKLEAGLLTSVSIGIKSGYYQLENYSAEDLKLKNNFIKPLQKRVPNSHLIINRFILMQQLRINRLK